jgi:hypothetical protein
MLTQRMLSTLELDLEREFCKGILSPRRRRLRLRKWAIRNGEESGRHFVLGFQYAYGALRYFLLAVVIDPVSGVFREWDSVNLLACLRRKRRIADVADLP